MDGRGPDGAGNWLISAAPFCSKNMPYHGIMLADMRQRESHCHAALR
jgi:hypothetical protein